MKNFYTAAAAAAALALSGAAFAQTGAAPAQQEQAQPSSPSSFTDAQLRSFAAASAEIDPISRTLQSATPEARAAATTQIRASLTRNNLDADTYNSIASAAQADPALAQRIASLRPSPNSGGGSSQQ